MKAYILSIIILYFCVSTVSYSQQQVTINQINAEISKGNFDKSKKMIDLYIAQNSLSSEEIYNLNFKKDVLDRIAIDFSKNKSDVVEFIKNIIPM